MRKPVIAGNWKLNLLRADAEALVRQLKLACDTEAVDVIVCPPFTVLAAVGQLLKGSRISLGGQDLFWESQGAFTGEVSAPMLTDVGCRYVIVGHSERRQYFGETDETIQRKVRAALAQGLTPIVCIGETLAQRDANQTFEVLRGQLEGGLKGCSADDVKRMILAYEPVWAIGTGRNATPEQAQEAHAVIRQWAAKRFGQHVADALRIQYGGSVNAANAASLLQQPDVDGALVGGASLKADAFSAIVKAAGEAKAAYRGRRKREMSDCELRIANWHPNPQWEATDALRSGPGGACAALDFPDRDHLAAGRAGRDGRSPGGCGGAVALRRRREYRHDENHRSRRGPVHGDVSFSGDPFDRQGPLGHRADPGPHGPAAAFVAS